jgi:hypothetical protein
VFWFDKTRHAAALENREKPARMLIVKKTPETSRQKIRDVTYLRLQKDYIH